MRIYSLDLRALAHSKKPELEPRVVLPAKKFPFSSAKFEEKLDIFSFSQVACCAGDEKHHRYYTLL